jgi:hypothetical protein
MCTTLKLGRHRKQSERAEQVFHGHKSTRQMKDIRFSIFIGGVKTGT